MPNCRLCNTEGVDKCEDCKGCEVCCECAHDCSCVTKQWDEEDERE